jgi:hypothetical protein
LIHLENTVLDGALAWVFRPRADARVAREVLSYEQEGSSARVFGLARAVALLIAVCLAWSVPALAQERSVEVEGVAAPAKGQAPISARSLAIDDALRKAVEIGVGVFLTNETIVKNFELISDKIYKRVSGFARVDKIINERVQDGKYYVRLAAVVSGDKLRSKLRDTIRNFSDPRIGVFLTETLDGKPTIARAASTQISKALVALGFRVLDQATLEQKLKRDQIAASLEDPQALKRVAASLQVDVLVVGSARASQAPDSASSPITQAGRVAARGVVELRLVDAVTAQVGWTDQFEAGDNDMTAEAAAAAALQTAGNAAAEALVPQLTGWIQGALTATSVFTLKIGGFKSYSSYNVFVQKLSTQPGVKNVQARDFNASLTVIEIEWGGKSESLAVMLEKMGLVVTNVIGGGREITARVK